MRIIAGSYKGMTLQAPAGRDTRPTTDRVREAWASTLVCLAGAGLSSLRVLDAFAGSGALGLELLSRGVASCLFCEQERRALAALRSNLAALAGQSTASDCAEPAPSLSAESAALPAGASLLAVDVLAARTISQLAARGPFDLLVLDPPYALPVARLQSWLGSLARIGALKPGALLSYEHARRPGGAPDPLDGLALCRACSPAALSLVSCKTYGSTQLSYYRYA